jgi:hypothetical protein
MRKTILLAGMLYGLSAVAGHATDVINQDNKGYKVKVQGEGKLSISAYDVSAGGSLYGLCGYAFCTFEIPGSKVSAKKEDRLTIRGGKFVQ